MSSANPELLILLPAQTNRKTNKSVNTDLARAFLSRKFMHKKADPQQDGPQPYNPYRNTPKKATPNTVITWVLCTHTTITYVYPVGKSDAKVEVEGEAFPLAALSGKLFLYHYYRSNMHMNMALPRSHVCLASPSWVLNPVRRCYGRLPKGLNRFCNA